jgi:hypothetical protein
MPITYPSPNSIILGGKELKLLQPGQIQTQELGTYPRKITIGDPTKDSQDFISTWIISDLTGGHGLGTHSSDATISRYRYATMDLTKPGIWSGRWKVNTETGTAGTFIPLGDLLVSGNIEMYSAFGQDLHVWNESTDAWTDTTSNLAAAPVNNGVAFAGTGTLRLFIPLGSTGYDTYTGAAHASVAASGSVPAVRMFAVFSQMLIALSTTNQLWWTTDGTTWTSFGVDGKVDGSVTAYRITKERDVMGNPTLAIATSGGVWVFDPGGPTLYEQDLEYPVHPDQGLAACSWRGEYYVSVGMGIHKWNPASGTIDAMGLDRDEGLPFTYSYNSKIVDLFPAYNEMYALVQGSTADSTQPTVQKWTGRGWHSVWELGSTGTASRLYVSQARSTYRVWWGVGNNSYTIELPRSFTNPKNIVQGAVSGRVQAGGTVETGLTDMAMSGYRKIAHSARVRFVGADANLAGTQTTLYYRTDDLTSYTALYPSYEVVIADEGYEQYDSIVYWFKEDRTGVAFDEIELKLSTLSNSVKYITMDFVKIPRRNLSWTFAVDLSGSYDDESPVTLFQHIRDLVDSETFTTMVHGTTTYYGRLASWSAVEMTGAHDTRIPSMTIQFIETRYEDAGVSA